MKQLIKRFFSETPKLFRVIRNLGATMALAVTTVEALKSNGVNVPDIITNIANGYILYSGLAMAFVAQLTTVWKDNSGNDLNP